jgi:hypothetical protein
MEFFPYSAEKLARFSFSLVLSPKECKGQDVERSFAVHKKQIPTSGNIGQKWGTRAKKNNLEADSRN